MRVSVVFAVAFLSGSLPAQLLRGTLLADINDAPAPPSGSHNGSVISNGSIAYFKGVDGHGGSSPILWASDGTTSNTVKLSDAVFSGTSFEEQFVFAPNGDLYFLSNELGVGVGLWRSDGTTAGTYRVLAPQAWTEEPSDLVLFDDDLWFLAGMASTGTEVWKTDLSTESTSLAFEIAAGVASGAGDLFAGGGKLYVTSPDETALYVTDGTLAGLSLAANFHSANEASFENTGESGSRVIFNIDGGASHRGWWGSDGTPGGTVRLQDSVNNVRWLVQAATKVYFSGGCCNGVLLLHESDGTLAGTLPVDLPSTTGGQRVDFQPGIAIGDELFYGGYSGANGVEPCRSPGAAAGATSLGDLNPGPADSDPSDFVAFGGHIFFRATAPATGNEMWKLDPVTNGVQVIDQTPGPVSKVVGNPLPTTHGVFYYWNDAIVGSEPHVTDGTAAGLLVNISPEAGSLDSDPTEWIRLGNQLLFAAEDEAVGRELFTTDGTPDGTKLLRDINPDTAETVGSYPIRFTELAGRVYFFAFHPDTGYEMWSTDGTAAGTELFVDLVPGPGSSGSAFAGQPVTLGDKLFFVAMTPTQEFALHVSDGTAAGTEVVMSLSDVTFTSDFKLTVAGDRVVFRSDLPSPVGVWATDGTPENTELLLTDTFLMAARVGETFTFLYTRDSGSQGSDHLWRTNGSPSGTQLLFSSTSDSSFRDPAVLGDTLVFSFDDGVTGLEPWVSDGTPLGTQQLQDIEPGPESSHALQFTSAGDRVFFTTAGAPSSTHFPRLWMTDGTTAGTEFVTEVPAPLAFGGIRDLWSPGQSRDVLFTNDEENGREIWASDGTAAGTVPITDIDPGPGSADPSPGALVRNRLVFVAEDGQHGREPHSLPLAVTGAFAATSIGSGCTGSNGEPGLVFGGGSVSVGDSFSIRLERGASSSTAFWFYGLNYGSVPGGGACSFQLPTPTYLAATSIDGAGASQVFLSVPSDPVLAGVQVDFQALSGELGGPFLGLGALSDVLEVIVSD